MINIRSVLQNTFNNGSKMQKINFSRADYQTLISLDATRPKMSGQDAIIRTGIISFHR